MVKLECILTSGLRPLHGNPHFCVPKGCLKREVRTARLLNVITRTFGSRICTGINGEACKLGTHNQIIQINKPAAISRIRSANLGARGRDESRPIEGGIRHILDEYLKN